MRVGAHRVFGEAKLLMTAADGRLQNSESLRLRKTRKFGSCYFGFSTRTNGRVVGSRTKTADAPLAQISAEIQKTRLPPSAYVGNGTA